MWCKTRIACAVVRITVRLVSVLALLAAPGVPVRAQTAPPLPKLVSFIKVLPYGFEPSVVEQDPGRILLVVHNRTGLRQITLRLDREVGGRLVEVSLPTTRVRWGQRLVLVPGKYVLTEANHPNWICRITISQ